MKQVLDHVHMRHRIELPRELGPTFSLKSAEAVGVRRGRRDARDLHRPFRGVRSTSPPLTFLHKVACHRPRMKPGYRYIGITAVRLWGLPHPTAWTDSEHIHLAVPPNRTPPKTKGVKARRIAEHRADTFTLGADDVVDPLTAVFTCAGTLTPDQAVVLVDALITPSDEYPNLQPIRPVYTLAEIGARLDEWRRFPGKDVLRAALARARVGVDSPKETETRLLIVAAGLPEPVVQHEVREHSRLIARIDLAYPELKIAIEYEGDGHRTNRDQWRRDIQRTRDLEDRGWIVIRLTQLDLADGSAKLLARIRRAILKRTR